MIYQAQVYGAVHTSELDRSEIDLSPKRSECERSNANWDRSKWVWTLSQSELRSISDRSNFRSILVWTAPNNSYEYFLQVVVRPKETTHNRNRNVFSEQLAVGDCKHKLQWKLVVQAIRKPGKTGQRTKNGVR